MTDDVLTFPRQKALTRGFRLGAPRAFHPSPDGRRVAFLRSGGGTDPVTRLWVLDVAEDGTSHERVAVDPLSLLGDDGEQLSQAEQARRERLREVSGGVTAFATDRDVRLAAFVLSGRPHVIDLADTDSRPLPLPAEADVVDPRPDPTGRHVAYASDRSLYVVPADGSAAPLALCRPESDTVTWGMAEFIAAEEMDRLRGFWWSPDGTVLLVERYDEAPVDTWWIADPAHPAAPPRSHRYPAAGTANADVSLWLVDLAGNRREIAWDREALPYLADVHWSADGDPLVTVQSRDQRRLVVLAAEVDGAEVDGAEVDGAEVDGAEVDGAAIGVESPVATRVVHEETDPAWVDLVPGLPRWVSGGRLLHAATEPSTRRLAVDGRPVTPQGLQVRAILDTDGDSALVLASTDPTRAAVYRVGLTDGDVVPVTGEDGWASARHGGGLTVTAATSLGSTATTVTVHRGGEQIATIPSLAQRPLVQPVVTLLSAGQRRIRTAVLWPTGHDPAAGPLPILLSPYGGPAAQRVVASGLAFATEQWLADQGFCVVVADGAGTPGRGPAWEREVHLDLARPVLDDQLTALSGVVERWPDAVDPGRVGIRGWSFGGYLSALAVLLRPDAFHAAVAGAPVTDWRWYDTHYTERYLGNPVTDPGPYDACSLLPLAERLTRPLLLVHGLSDDNVVVAHTLGLSGALLAAGRPHTVLPLSGVTHMTPQEVVAENLLRLEVDFLRRSLAQPSDTPTLT